LEYGATAWLATAADRNLRRFWIDGFIPEAMRNTKRGEMLKALCGLARVRALSISIDSSPRCRRSYFMAVFLGTLIYDGRVYDHIQFHNRGQASTYLAGNNKWGFKLNPSQEFEARDLWGRRYRYPWRGLDLNACASPTPRTMASLEKRAVIAAVLYARWDFKKIEGILKKRLG